MVWFSSCFILLYLFSRRRTTAFETRAPPRTGIAQKILDFALETPIWKFVLVPQARATMVKTAESNGIPWNGSKEWIKRNSKIVDIQDYFFPDYYLREFHAYEEGNLSWEAAWEVEIASCSVGARNFPQYGSRGEDAFRGAFDSAIQEAGGVVPPNGKMLDLGSGTGMSTRRLGFNFPQAKSIQGIDLSPYFIEIGKQLLHLEPKSFEEGGPWVSSITNDDRINYSVGDAADTKLESESCDVVNLQFVLHELPKEVSLQIVDEAMRLLKPDGQLWICEMDFESPAYAEQRANALLFSLIRSTEPYLDEYAESISDLFRYIQSKSRTVTVVPATGRHYALVATKKRTSEDTQEFKDLRFDENGDYRVEDTHLKTFWESKEESR